MATEIYIRKPNVKGKIEDNKRETTDLLDMFIQQIEITLSTPRNRVLGATDFGVSLQYYLHTLGNRPSDIISLVTEQIYKNCPLSNKFNFKVDVEFFALDNGDAMTVDIFIENDNLVRIAVN